jgi:hypothetical protein
MDRTGVGDFCLVVSENPNELLTSMILGVVAIVSCLTDG